MARTVIESGVKRHGVGSDDRWERIAALAGVAVGVLFVAILLVAGEVPKAPASGQEVSSFFAEHRSALLTVAYLEGLTAVAMIWFWGVLRSVLARAEGDTARLANMVLAAGAGLALLYLLSGAFWGVLAYHSVTAADPGMAAVLYRLGAVTFQAGAFPLGAALLAAGVAGVRFRALPSWLSWITAAFGVVAVILRAIPEETYGPERIGTVAFLLVPLWFAVAGIVLARRTVRTEPHVVPTVE